MASASRRFATSAAALDAAEGVQLLEVAGLPQHRGAQGAQCSVGERLIPLRRPAGQRPAPPIRCARATHERDPERRRFGCAGGCTCSGSADGSVTAKLIDQKITELRTELDELGQFLLDEIVKVQTEVHEIAARVDEHDAHIDMLTEGQSSLNQRVDDVAAQKSGVNPLGPILIGLLAGIVGWGAWLGHTFTSAPAANNPWAAVLAGVAVGGLGFALCYALWPAKKPATAQPPAQTQTTDTVVAEQEKEGAHAQS